VQLRGLVDDAGIMEWPVGVGGTQQGDCWGTSCGTSFEYSVYLQVA
jgi:hypothetical protein